MSLWDGLIALGVLEGFGFVIFAKVMSNNPKLKDWIHNFFASKPKVPIPEIGTHREQLYPERADMI